MKDDSRDMTRREWMRRVAMAAAAGGVVSALSSCRNDGGGAVMARAAAGDDSPNLFDADEIMAQLPGEIDCVECVRCMPCGFGVDIPGMFHEWNEAVKADEIPHDAAELTDGRGAVGLLRGLESNIGDRHLAHRCALCGKCHKACPMKLPIARYMRAIGRFIDLARETETMS